MADWLNINDIVDEEWWEKAYKLFLENNPVEKILGHSQLYMTGDNWDCFGFNRNTHVPPTGKVNDVSKRAILMVISKSMRRYWSWKDLQPSREPDVQDLEDNHKKLINCVIDLIYKEDGSPRPFNK
ncbi:hypothetical protein PO909_031850 [Leuciscus waleckii]